MIRNIEMRKPHQLESSKLSDFGPKKVSQEFRKRRPEIKGSILNQFNLSKHFCAFDKYQLKKLQGKHQK